MTKKKQTQSRELAAADVNAAGDEQRAYLTRVRLAGRAFLKAHAAPGLELQLAQVLDGMAQAVRTGLEQAKTDARARSWAESDQFRNKAVK